MKLIGKALEKLGFYIFLSSFFSLGAALVVFLIPFLRWLRTGVQQETISVITLLRQVSPVGSWPWNPTDWFGVYQFLDNIPVSLGLVFLAPVLGYVGLSFLDLSSKVLNPSR